MKTNLKDQILAERGESIGEALAAILIVALGALMLEAMTSAATRIVTRSEKAYASYLDQRNYIESYAHVTDKNVKDGEDTYESKAVSGTISLWQNSSDSMAATATIPVEASIIKNKSTGKVEAAWYRYKKDAAQQGTQTGDSGE